MSGIGPVQYVTRVRRDLDGLAVPARPTRRAGVRDLDYLLRNIRIGISWVDEAVSDGSYPALDGARAACERARELTSLLYAAGADDHEWRHWSAWSSFGLMLMAASANGADGEELAESLQYAVLAGEWQLAAALSDVRPPAFNRYADYVVWALAAGRTDIEPPWDGDDDTAEVWRSFANGVINQHPNATTLALDTIAEVHMDTFGDDWKRFVPWEHPLFDLVAGAGAALARHRGLVTDDLSDLNRCYLGPGLAPGEPTPLYPVEWPEPSAVAKPSAN